MQYYLKNPVSGDIEGPFSTERLNEMIARSAINPDSLATSDLGEPLAQIKKQRSDDWFSLGDIPGVIGIPPAEKENLPTFSRETKIGLLLLALTILALVLWWFMKAAAASGLSDS